MSPQVSLARSRFLLPFVMCRFYHGIQALWETRAEKNNPETWTQGELLEETNFLYQEPLRSEDRRISASYRMLGSISLSCPSRISSDPIPTPTHLCPPCFLSHLQHLDSRRSLGVLDNRNHMGIRIGLDRHWNTTPNAGMKGLTCWPRRTRVAWLTLGTRRSCCTRSAWNTLHSRLSWRVNGDVRVRIEWHKGSPPSMTCIS